jgi:hypothetical protein
MAKEKRYQAFCTRYYSCHLGEATTSKRQAWRTAASHMSACHYDVDVLDTVEEARRKAEREAAKSVALG